MIRACIHFRGAQTTCGADVDVEAMRDAELRLPCQEIRGTAGQHACARRIWPAAAAAGEPGRMRQRLDRITEDRCPICAGPITGERAIDSHIIALPCRHVLRSGGTE